MSLRILFFGTQDNGAPFLKGLLANGKHPAAGVVVPPQKKIAGRGPRAWLRMAQQTWQGWMPPAGTTSGIARRAGLPVWNQPLNTASFSEFVARLKPDLFVVASFSRILKPQTLSLAPRGVINVHPSLLPKYRGADPIFWALVNNEKETGITVHWMDEGVDTGSLLGQRVLPIGEGEDSISLARKLTAAGVELLVEVLDQIESGRAVSVSQDEAGASYFPPASKEYRTIRWEDCADSIQRLVRASISYGGASAVIEGRPVKIIKSEAMERTPQPFPGRLLDRRDGWAKVSCKDAVLKLVFAGGTS
ncbi:MAG: methionyl-tRNA formyltransferase [Chloroflexi bacterium]|nr:methionyl-tRNA formyltransferase [Chloroflexota bacterium]MDL1943034.1 methionyl-tRNA formyltransferase [Chloroflexi bacterium CFX2]